MEQQQLSIINLTSHKDWDLTPKTVKDFVLLQKQRIEQLEKQLAQFQIQQDLLIEKANINSQNSDLPPSTEIVKPHNKNLNSGKKKKRGGQLGHQGFSRKLYDEKDCTSIQDHKPHICKCCGEKLSGNDTNPYRHQVVEIPQIKLQIEEHRLHQLQCHKCGAKTRAKLPTTCSQSGYGERLVALVSVMNGVYRHSHRMIVSAMKDFFGVVMSLGTVTRIRNEVSEAISTAVSEAKEYIQSAAMVNADETSFAQGNSDGKNREKKKAWLWVAATNTINYFQVSLSRTQKVAKDLLGEDFEGILTSDRYGGYNWVDLQQRQLCWAHLTREFKKISERRGASRQVGRDLMAQEKKLFRLWRKVSVGKLNRKEFELLVKPIKKRLGEILIETAEFEIGYREKTPWAKTVRTCRQLRKVESALWRFVEIDGLEPTNNLAERALRPAVLWRKTSFGTESKAGSVFVGRILTVVSSLKSQNRDILDFLCKSISARRKGEQAPSLIPTVEEYNGKNEIPQILKLLLN